MRPFAASLSQKKKPARGRLVASVKEYLFMRIVNGDDF
jgi:hypothetical protein